MQLEIIGVLVPFQIVCISFIQKKVHMMLALMFDPRFKDLFIFSSHVIIEKITTTTTKYNFET
jgi:hypothetical protein